MRAKKKKSCLWSKGKISKINKYVKQQQRKGQSHKRRIQSFIMPKHVNKIEDSMNENAISKEKTNPRKGSTKPTKRLSIL